MGKKSLDNVKASGYGRQQRPLATQIIMQRSIVEQCEDDFIVAVLRLQEAREKLAELEAALAGRDVA